MKYLYYKLFQTIKPAKTNTSPKLSALLFMIILEYINIITIKLAIFGNKDFRFANKGDVKTYALVIGVILFTLNYFYLFKNHTKIYSKYKGEKKSNYRMGFVYLALYILFTIVAMYIEVRKNHLY